MNSRLIYYYEQMAAFCYINLKLHSAIWLNTPKRFDTMKKRVVNETGSIRIYDQGVKTLIISIINPKSQ